jgi:hypothetical protein
MGLGCILYEWDYAGEKAEAKIAIQDTWNVIKQKLAQ